MTVERHIELQDRLREVLGEQPAATLWSMLPGREDLATKSDLTEMGTTLRTQIAGVREELKEEIAGVRDQLKDEIADLRTEVATFRTEMEHRYATRDDVQGMADRFIDVMAGHVRTFIVVQAATVVGMSGILFGFLQLT
jgi:hypothetical protein